MTTKENFMDLEAKGFAPYYDSNGRFMGYLIVMSYSYNGTSYGFYSRETGKCIIFRNYARFNETYEGPNGIKYIFQHKTDFGDIYYVGAITKNIVVNI